MVWEGPEVILTGRKMLGATNPNSSEPGENRKTQPFNLRAPQDEVPVLSALTRQSHVHVPRGHSTQSFAIPEGFTISKTRRHFLVEVSMQRPEFAELRCWLG